MSNEEPWAERTLSHPTCTAAKASMQKAKSYHDTPHSWLMAAACSWTVFWVVAVNRCSGIFFVAMVNQLEISRQEASWPFTLIGCVSQLTALAWNLLLRVMSLRSVHILGSVMSASGVLLCAAFRSITGITVCLGVITAIGQGMIFPSNSVVINTHFNTYRASASGISYAGTTVVSLVSPPVVFYLMDTYGLRGTFLIVGGLAMNGIAGSLLVNRPEDYQTSAKVGKEAVAGEADDRGTFKYVVSRMKKVFQEELSLLKKPMYFVIVGSVLAVRYMLGIFIITAVDYAGTKGLGRWEITIFLSCQSAGELCGRIFSGQLSDRKIFHRRDVMAAAFLMMSASLVSFVLSESVAVLALSCFTLGLASGCAVILFSVLYSEYFGLDLLPTALTCAALINGMLDAPKPLLIGHYRDHGRSYSSLYMLLCAIGFVASLAWFIEIFHQWVLSRRKAGDVR